MYRKRAVFLFPNLCFHFPTAMRFQVKYYVSIIPEWKDKYLDYKGLCLQIKLVKRAALKLAQNYASIRGTNLFHHPYLTLAITGEPVDLEIHIDQLGGEKVFWNMLESNLQAIDDFYNKQLAVFIEQFHMLTMQAIQLVCFLALQ